MKIHHGDALSFPIGQHVNKDYTKPWNSDKLPNAFLVGNLPFNIATPLLFKLLLKISDRNGIFSLGFIFLNLFVKNILIRIIIFIIGRVPMTFLFQNGYI